MYDPALGRWHVLDPLQEDEYNRDFEAAFAEEMGEDYSEESLADGREANRDITDRFRPIKLTPGNSAVHYSVSPYAYVLNNPINYKDWMGLATLKEVVVTASRLPEGVPYEIGVDLTLIQIGQPINTFKPVGVFGLKPGSSIASAGLSKVFTGRSKTLKRTERKIVAKLVSTKGRYRSCWKIFRSSSSLDCGCFSR